MWFQTLLNCLSQATSEIVMQPPEPLSQSEVTHALLFWSSYWKGWILPALTCLQSRNSYILLLTHLSSSKALLLWLLTKLEGWHRKMAHAHHKKNYNKRGVGNAKFSADLSQPGLKLMTTEQFLSFQVHTVHCVLKSNPRKRWDNHSPAITTLQWPLQLHTSNYPCARAWWEVCLPLSISLWKDEKK